MTDLTSARPVDLDWQDDETSMYGHDQQDADLGYLIGGAAGILACFPVGFCVVAVRHWLGF